MAKDSLTVTDNRTGKSYELPINDGTIRALDLREIKTGADDFGLAVVRSRVLEHGVLSLVDHLHRR